MTSSDITERPMLSVRRSPDESDESDAHVMNMNTGDHDALQGCDADRVRVRVDSCPSAEANVHENMNGAEFREDGDLIDMDMDSSSGSSASSTPENENEGKGSSDSLYTLDEDGDGDDNANNPKSGGGGTVVLQSQRRPIVRTILFIVLLLTMGFPLKLFIDGCSCLMHYRAFFGDKAPLPFSPMHGVVIGMGNDANENKNEVVLQKDGKNPSSLASFEGYQFNTFMDSEKDLEIIHDAQSKAPIRLLIIGDSIARGVGTSKACYPRLPENLSTILSKRFEGRPVYWTAYGEPGATIKWIANRIEEQSLKRRKLLKDESYASSLPSLKEFYDLTGNAIDDGKTSPSEIKQVWVDRLDYHQKLYETNPFGGYDIIIAVSGINDIKRALVPFLCQDDIDTEYVGDDTESDSTDRSTDRPAMKREKGFAGDIQRMLKNFIDNSGFDEINNNGDPPSTCGTDGEKSEECKVEPENKIRRRAHIFLPSFPADVVPAKMGKILRWIGITSTTMLDNIKRQEAEKYPYEHAFGLPAPIEEDGVEFIDGTSKIWDLLYDSEIKMQLVKASSSECKNLVGKMSHFYSNNVAPHEDYPCNALFSSDAIHPSDAGYDFFARAMTDNIAEKLVFDET